MVEFMDLPLDLMTNILILLSGKTLMQFKCVCKTWYQLISSNQFASLHLDKTLTLTLTESENPNLHFIFSSPHLCSADFDICDRITELDHPFRKSDPGYVNVVGSCHGLLCLYSCDPLLTIFLYNPTTRTHRKLPILPRSSEFSLSMAFGFGYDDVSKDYKFVRILYSNQELTKPPLWSQVMVYSLRTDSWTKFGDLPQPFGPRREDAVLADGNLHWLHGVFDGVTMTYSIVSFSLRDHKFGEVQQPSYEEDQVVLSVGALEGCLCILANDLEDTDIWIMKEYGVAESWTRLLKIRQQRAGLYFEWPIAFSLNRRELFLQLYTLRVVALDLETGVIRDVKFCDFPRCFDTHVCVENLMMLKDASNEIPEINPKCGKKRKWKRLRQQTKNQS